MAAWSTAERVTENMTPATKKAYDEIVDIINRARKNLSNEDFIELADEVCDQCDAMSTAASDDLARQDDDTDEDAE